MLPKKEAQVRSLLWELRSFMLYGTAEKLKLKKKKKKKRDEIGKGSGTRKGKERRHSYRPWQMYLSA